MQYVTRQMKIGKTQQLDFLTRQAGEVYSKAVVSFWRIHRRRDHWLSSNSMQRLIRNNHLHSQTVQRIIQSFYEALKSWNSLRKTNPNARPPRRLDKYHPIPFKTSAILIKDGMLTLSTGKGNEPVRVPWNHDLPKYCEISFNGEQYVLSAVYKISMEAETLGNAHAGVDLGQKHIAAVNTGNKTIIANGKELYSKRIYLVYIKAHFYAEMKKCVKYSRKWNRLNNRRKRTVKKLKNQIRDILHKQTTAIVCAMKEEGVQTVGIGHMQNMRTDADKRTPIGKARTVLTYKLRRAGMETLFVDEKFTSQTCPKCGWRNKTRDRNYTCDKCGFAYHRDGVGAYNIRSISKYREFVPVIGDMTPPVGIRYYADSSRTSAATTA